VPQIGRGTQELGWTVEGGRGGNATAEDPEYQVDLSAHEQAEEQTPAEGVAPSTRQAIRTPPPEQVGGEDGDQNNRKRGRHELRPCMPVRREDITRLLYQKRPTRDGVIDFAHMT
jgi:hypothetical protein